MNDQDPHCARRLHEGERFPPNGTPPPQLFERERERISAASWNYVGRVEQVAKVGDFLTCRVGQVPVVIVREEAGTLRAYANVCRHRGSELVLEQCGNRRALQCHYHAWSWGLDGTLRASLGIRQRASVGSTEASASLPARVGVVGPKQSSIARRHHPDERGVIERNTAPVGPARPRFHAPAGRPWN